MLNFLLENQFLFRAIVGCIGISFICPVLGVFLMFRRMSLMGDAISHAILPGVALGFMLGGMSVISMAFGGLIAGLSVTILAGVISRRTELKEDASFASFYLIALALGVILISKSGTNLDLIHILFGSILAVDKLSLIILASVISFSLIVLMIIIRPLVIDTFDKSILCSYGIKTNFYHLAFLFIVVLNLVIDFQLLGTILVIGLMILPAGVGKILGKSLNNILLIALLTSVLSSIFGILFSYYFDLATGPAIVLTNGIFYILSLVYTNLNKLFTKPHFKH